MWSSTDSTRRPLTEAAACRTWGEEAGGANKMMQRNAQHCPGGQCDTGSPACPLPRPQGPRPSPAGCTLLPVLLLRAMPAQAGPYPPTRALAAQALNMARTASNAVCGCVSSVPPRAVRTASSAAPGRVSSGRAAPSPPHTHTAHPHAAHTASSAAPGRVSSGRPSCCPPFSQHTRHVPHAAQPLAESAQAGRLLVPPHTHTQDIPFPAQHRAVSAQAGPAAR